MKWRKFTFYGLGLIGGSLAKAIRKYYPSARISAIEKNPYAIECAKKEGILNRELYNASEIEEDTDILFLCAPVEWNRAFLKEIKPYLSKQTILTDVGSTKSSIMEEANTLQLSAQFCGGHPMAGAEISGFSASDPLLLQNAYYILTPGIDFPKAKLDALTVFLASIGSIPFRMNPEEHDRTVAMVSHLPHLLAAGLVTLLKEEDQDDKMKKLAAGGFKDITRIASSSPLMWQQICTSNKDAIVEMMDDYLHLLEKIKDQIKKEEPEAISELFREAGQYRNAMDGSAQGLIHSAYEISIHVEDHPGAISIISTILASNMVSIRNIGINHNREKGEGALQISFYTGEDCAMAKKLLLKYGFRL